MAGKKEEKSKTAKLKEEILMKKDKGIKTLSKEEIKKADEFCKGYSEFLDNSPIEREAVRYSEELAKKAGFKEFNQDKKYKPGDKVYLINRDKAIAL
ncbi:MAG: aminopeptidase, partial [Oscillospiraceae bacterium]|nr:aminopeptidase [Oscillospiraceae bacterium]